MKITAIILNFNNYEDLKECLKSIELQDANKEHEINVVIIDNNSEDESTQKIKIEFPKHEYIFNTENLGFSKGVNQGIKKTWNNSDLFILINNDAYLEASCINELLSSIEEFDNVGISGPKIFYKHKPEIIWQSGGFFKKIKMGISVKDKNKEFKKTKKKFNDVDFVSGCIMLLNKKMLEKIGLFDENFFFYGEDLDICLRAKKLGFRVIYNSEATSWHNIKEITKTRTSPFVLENLSKSYALIAKKHYPNLIVYSSLIFLLLYTPFRMLQIIIGGNNILNIKFWIKGFFDGLKIKI